MRDTNDPWVLGVSISHNGSACLYHGDRLVVAVQEERLLGQKRARINGCDGALCVRYCLDHVGIDAGDLSAVGVSIQGSTRREDYDLGRSPQLRLVHHRTPLFVVSHHRAHALSAYATSGFDEAALLVCDGLGSHGRDLAPDEKAVFLGDAERDWEFASVYHARGGRCEAREKHAVANGDWVEWGRDGLLPFRSLGGIFSSVAMLLFGNAMEAGKVMGLAPYGTPRFPVEDFFTIEGDRFVFHTRLLEHFKVGARWPAREKDYQDLAASAQVAIERALLHLCARARELTGSPRLCLAGGVALNSIANERIVREGGFDEVYFVPAAEDSGPCLGAAWHALGQVAGERPTRRLTRDSLGRTYRDVEVARAVAVTPGITAVACDDVLEQTVDLLCEGRFVGWFQGGSELGPRALGQRSILCDPRREDAKPRLNDRVKHREAFRPFAPSALLEHADEWFEFSDGEPRESPFMLRVLKFRPEVRARVPAVVHVDGTGRLQTLTAEANGRFYDLVRAFHRRTGVPMLLNTSFNVMGEPIVETPEDALWCLLTTGLDACVLHDTLVTKAPDAGFVRGLVPRLVAKRVRVEVPQPEGGFSLDVLQKGAALFFDVETRWGEKTFDFSAANALGLRYIDGRRTVGAILTKMRAHAPVFEREYLVFLNGLRRRGAVVLEPAPDASGFGDLPSHGDA